MYVAVFLCVPMITLQHLIFGHIRLGRCNVKILRHKNCFGISSGRRNS